jgi:hypothetical protein
MMRVPGMLVLLLWCALPGVALATAAAAGQHVSAQGARDGSAPAWTIATDAPPGWTADCCTYARAIGVNLVLYQGTWSGEPNRVMVLNVWPRKLPTLAAEWRADRTHYLKRDPRAKVGRFDVGRAAMACHGLLYQGTDLVDDIVVFCDPGKASGIRLSWSMTLAADDPQRVPVSALFRKVVEQSAYAPTSPALRSAAGATTH